MVSGQWLKQAVKLPALADTEALGRRLGASLVAGDVVALVGQLGAGKTTLVRAVCEGLGVANLAAVTSPTFTLVHEYAGRLPVFHFDAYRLKSAREFLELGFEEYLTSGGVCLIEWADLVADALPARRLTLELAHAEGGGRRAVVFGPGTPGDLTPLPLSQKERG